MYAKPTVADFVAALTERGEEIGAAFGRALDTVISRNAAAGRLRSGATVKMVLAAAREGLDEGTNKLLRDLQQFSRNAGLDRDELRAITGEHFRLLVSIVLGVAQGAIDKLDIGDAAQRMVDQMKDDMVKLVDRRLRQFDIGVWQERNGGSVVATNTINAGSIIGGIQQGTSGSTQQVSQSVAIEALPAAVADLEAALADCPTGPVVDDLRADIAAVQSQIAKAQPSHGVLAEIGKSMRSLVEGVTAGALTPSAVAAAMSVARLLGVAQ